VNGLEAVLAAHPWHPVFGCECTPEDDETGEKVVLEHTWEAHLVAAIVAHLTSDAVVEAAARAVVDLRFPGDRLVDNDLAVMLTALTAATEATP
jgi:hypothetical protein